MQAPNVVPIDRLSLQYRQQRWPFADQHRVEIDAHFERLRRERTGIWNGQVLMMHHHRLEQGAWMGRLRPAYGACFLMWRDWAFPEAGVTNCFSMGALGTRAVASLVRVMGAHTAGAGKIYFP